MQYPDSAWQQKLVGGINTYQSTAEGKLIQVPETLPIKWLVMNEDGRWYGCNGLRPEPATSVSDGRGHWTNKTIAHRNSYWIDFAEEEFTKLVLPELEGLKKWREMIFLNPWASSSFATKT